MPTFLLFLKLKFLHMSFLEKKVYCTPCIRCVQFAGPFNQAHTF